MKKRISTKKIIFSVLFILIIALFFNIFAYCLNQKILKEILVENNVYQLEDNFEKAKAVTSITNKIVKNLSKESGKTFMCRTPRMIIKNGGVCGDKAFLAISMLRLLDIDARPLGLCKNADDDLFMHVVVEAKIYDKWLVFDPSYNLSYNATKEQLSNKSLLISYVNRIADESQEEYNLKYDYDDTAHFRYSLFGPLKKPTIHLSNLLEEKFDYTFHQYYFMIQCELRNIFLLTVMIIILILLLLINKMRVIKKWAK